MANQNNLVNKSLREKLDLIANPVVESSVTENILEDTPIPEGTPLSKILLPNKWVLYLYDKQLFKKMANRTNFQAKPYKELCTISTVNDLIYILKLMEVRIENDKNHPHYKKLNLDTNDYIIMRHGIEPIWEDPKNSNGGTFTVKMRHTIGYDTWATFLMYMLGETMSPDMETINGITVSYISDNTNHFRESKIPDNMDYTYIKIWDGKLNRTKEEFISILPDVILDKIKNESMMYSQNNTKKDFGEKTIVEKLNNNRRDQGNKYQRGGFMSRGRNAVRGRGRS